MVGPEHAGLSIVRQCELLVISRSGRYYKATGESAENLALMRLHLQRLGHKVGRHKIARLMRKMGLAAIYQKPNTSRPNPENRIYPYLLRFGAGDGLVQPQGAVMAGVKHHGCGFLH